MKWHHWLLVVVVALLGGYVAGIIGHRSHLCMSGSRPRAEQAPSPIDSVADQAEPFSVSHPNPLYVRAEQLGFQQDTLEINVPANHKLTVLACSYRNGKYDGQLSRGLELVHPEGGTYTVTAGVCDPDIPGEEAPKQVRLYAKVRTGKHDALGGMSSCFLEKWIDGPEQNDFHSSGPALDKVVPGKETFWYGIGLGGSGIQTGDGGITSRNPFVCNFYICIEPMSEDEMARKVQVNSTLALKAPPAGIPAELTGKQF